MLRRLKSGLRGLLHGASAGSSSTPAASDHGAADPRIFAVSAFVDAERLRVDYTLVNPTAGTLYVRSGVAPGIRSPTYRERALSPDEIMPAHTYAYPAYPGCFEITLGEMSSSWSPSPAERASCPAVPPGETKTFHLGFALTLVTRRPHGAFFVDQSETAEAVVSSLCIRIECALLDGSPREHWMGDHQGTTRFLTLTRSAVALSAPIKLAPAAPPRRLAPSPVTTREAVDSGDRPEGPCPGPAPGPCLNPPTWTRDGGS